MFITILRLTDFRYFTRFYLRKNKMAFINKSTKTGKKPNQKIQELLECKTGAKATMDAVVNLVSNIAAPGQVVEGKYSPDQEGYDIILALYTKCNELNAQLCKAAMTGIGFCNGYEEIIKQGHTTTTAALKGATEGAITGAQQSVAQLFSTGAATQLPFGQVPQLRRQQQVPQMMLMPTQATQATQRTRIKNDNNNPNTKCHSGHLCNFKGSTCHRNHDSSAPLGATTTTFGSPAFSASAPGAFAGMDELTNALQSSHSSSDSA